MSKYRSIDRVRNQSELETKACNWCQVQEKSRPGEVTHGFLVAPYWLKLTKYVGYDWVKKISVI